MVYKVIITPLARHQLEMYIAYTLSSFKNTQAARSIRDDSLRTKARLAKMAGVLAPCDNPILSKHGYHKIHFDKHDFFMVYRIDEDKAIVDAMYHELQDYEEVFISKMNLS